MFAQNGWSVPAADALADTAGLAERIRATPLRHSVVAALDTWAGIWATAALPDEARVRPVLELARRLDPDPWRDRFREWPTWSDAGALKAVLKDLQAESQPPRILIAAATLKRVRGQSSIELLQSALLRHPGDFWLNVNLAHEVHASRPSEAAGLYRTALALRPDSLFVLNSLGNTLLKQGKHREAMSYFHKAVEREPNYVYAHCNLAQGYHHQRDFDRAIEHYLKALAIAPDLPGIHSDLAVSYVERGDMDLAKKHLEAAVGKDGDYAVGHSNLAITLRFQSKFTDALREMRRAHELKPTPVRAAFIKEFQWIAGLQQREPQQPVDWRTLEKGVAGELTAQHPRDIWRADNGGLRASHLVAFQGGRSYQVDLAGDFDTILRVEDALYRTIQFNDDVRFPDVLDSRLLFTPERGGAFRVVATAFKPKTTGRYELRIREAVPVGAAQRLHGELAASDKRDKGRHYQYHTLRLTGDQPYVVALESPDFDTRIRLFDADVKKALGQNDWQFHENRRLSRLHVTPAETASHILMVSSVTPEAVGNYAVTVQRYALKEP